MSGGRLHGKGQLSGRDLKDGGRCTLRSRLSPPALLPTKPLPSSRDLYIYGLPHLTCESLPWRRQRVCEVSLPDLRSSPFLRCCVIESPPTQRHRSDRARIVRATTWSLSHDAHSLSLLGRLRFFTGSNTWISAAIGTTPAASKLLANLICLVKAAVSGHLVRGLDGLLFTPILFQCHRGCAHDGDKY